MTTLLESIRLADTKDKLLIYQLIKSFMKHKMPSLYFDLVQTIIEVEPTGDPISFEIKKLILLKAEYIKNKQKNTKSNLFILQRALNRADEIDLFMKHIKSFVDISTSVYVDIGSGDSSVTHAVKTKFNFLKAIAVEIVDIKNKYDDVINLTCLNSEIKIESNSVNLITAFMSIHHFNDTTRMLNEMNRILKIGGYLLIREHDCPDKAYEIYLNFVHAYYEPISNESSIPIFVDQTSKLCYAKYRSKKKWIELLTQYGFNEVDVNYTEKTDSFRSFYMLFQKI